nr:hypothetical protein [Tanacetum cinerariifolium]
VERHIAGGQGGGVEGNDAGAGIVGAVGHVHRVGGRLAGQRNSGAGAAGRARASVGGSSVVKYRLAGGGRGRAADGGGQVGLAAPRQTQDGNLLAGRVVHGFGRAVSRRYVLHRHRKGQHNIAIGAARGVGARYGVVGEGISRRQGHIGPREGYGGAIGLGARKRNAVDKVGRCSASYRAPVNVAYHHREVVQKA